MKVFLRPMIKSPGALFLEFELRRLVILVLTPDTGLADALQYPCIHTAAQSLGDVSVSVVGEGQHALACRWCRA